MGNSVSRATRSRSACRWISTAISRCVWLACTTLSAILEPALDRLVSISPSSFNTDAMPVWIAFTTALEADCTALTTHPSHAAWACTGIHSRAAAVKDAMDAPFFIEISVLSDPSCRFGLRRSGFTRRLEVRWPAHIRWGRCGWCIQERALRLCARRLKRCGRRLPGFFCQRLTGLLPDFSERGDHDGTVAQPLRRIFRKMIQTGALQIIE